MALVSSGPISNAQIILEGPAARKENRIAFENAGGFFGQGVCWWHSRLQRSFLYLAQFRPDLPAPDFREVKKIVRKLIQQKEPVVIPGYKNTYEFTEAYQNLIQKKLNGWFWKDSILGAAYVEGLSGRWKMPADQLEKHMAKLYGQFLIANANGDLLWLKLQQAGVRAHAALLLEMEPLPEGGFNLVVIDSNFPLWNSRMFYRPGMETLPGNYNFDGIPYIGKNRDLKKIRKGLQLEPEKTSSASRSGSSE